MAKKKNPDQVIVRVSMENGVPRVRPLTTQEQRQFLKTHPTSRLPTCSLADIERMTESLEETIRTIDPRMTGPSAR